MILLACEGPCEQRLMAKLLEAEALIFSARDLLDERPWHLRQIQPVLPLVNLLPLKEPLEIYRIGDTQKDSFRTDGLSLREVTVKKYCTKPEIEILIIILADRYKEYVKVKSKVKPKEFVREQLPELAKFGDALDAFVAAEWAAAIMSYKELQGAHKKDEHYLADLLKDGRE